MATLGFRVGVVFGLGMRWGVVLRLEVLDFAGPTRWRWRLTQAVGGGFVADHDVVLDAGEWQYEAFTDLDDYLRWNAAPDRRLASEAELTAAVGTWIGQRVFGPVGTALAQNPQAVCLEVPVGAEVLAYRPWELAYVGGRALAAQRVSVVIDQFTRAPQTKTPIGERLRMLAVFSLPEDASALNLRRERYALARLVHEIAATNNKAIELRVLQYGATRTRLEDALLEEEGWDVLHISGHGLPAGLVLEDDSGRRDLVSSRELVELLELATQQIKLVTLSACESAAVTAAEHLQQLGLGPSAPAGDTDHDPTPPHGQGRSGVAAEDGGADGAGAGAASLPAVATELVRRLDCAVLAMRYPVVDDFAIALAGSFYNLVLGKGQSVARALALTLPRILEDPPTPGAPALSVATPALFGARAGDLKLPAPPGGPLVFQAEQHKLAAFPPQPTRFVGRVGPMTRATTALAPRSGRSGVLFHGMAGAGKTACALELAYTHQAGFARLVWHQAPAEGHDITSALTNLVLDLEAQLPGLTMAHLVDDTAALRAFLPTLAEFLEQQRVLLVLDNLESLLNADGQWRDPRWELVVDALTGHGGLSRVVLTSRRRPARLHPAILVEPVHALSLTEAVLLAREWPHLRALLDATSSGLTGQQARGLAARTLAIVQGHPKLIELANGQATNPTALAARLDEADQTWLTTGTRLESFLDRGEPTATDRDYLRVLDGWTRSTTTTLPDGAATLFALLCCLEPDDRIGPVLEGNWADLWQRLAKPGQPPDIDVALAPLLEQALVAVDRDSDSSQPQRFHLHPGVAESGRTSAGPDFSIAVDTELAAYWLTGLQQGRDQENQEMGWLILRAARGAAPYLLRQHHWETLDNVMGSVLYRDQSPGTIAALLPILHAAADATCGTDLEPRAGRSYARALAVTRPDQAQTQLRQLLDTAVAQQDFGLASMIAVDIIRLCIDAGRLDEALTLTEGMKDYTLRAGYGPWTQLSDEAQRLQILGMQQGHAEQVLDAVEQHRATMATLPESSDESEVARPWNVREAILSTGRTAAMDLGRWQQALDLNAETLESKRRRDATDAEQARTAFNDYAALLRLGRTSQARELLLGCYAIFETEHNVPALGKTLSALADVEDEMGRGERAIELEKDALRLSYTSHNAEAIGVSHNNLANYLNRHGGDAQQAWAHRLAAAVIAYQTGGGAVTRRIHFLAQLLAQDGESAPPASFEQVCRIVDQVQGVHLENLVARLPQRAPDGQAAMTEVLRLARDLPPEDALDLQRHLDWWEPVISGLVAADRGDQAAADTVNQALATRGEQADWEQLVAVLRRLRAGEQDSALATGLDPIDTAIVNRALDGLTGIIQVDTDAWHTLTTPTPEQQPEQALAALVAATVAAAGGDPDAANNLQPLLGEFAADADWAALAAVLRRIIAGERDPALLNGLDPTDTAVVTTILDQLN